MGGESAWQQAARLKGIQVDGIFPILELLGSGPDCCENVIGDNAAPSDLVPN